MSQTTREFGVNEWLLHEMHVRYLEDPASVSEAWREFFQDYDGPIRRSELVEGAAPPGAVPAADSDRQATIVQLINQYRVRGHLIADLDPLSDGPREIRSELDPRTYGFGDEDLDRRFVTGGLAGQDVLTLREILEILRRTYCGTSAAEYMHSQDPEQKEWIQRRVEIPQTPLTTEARLQILGQLSQAEALERFLHRRYTGHRRYSLEGAESLIPMLATILDSAAAGGIGEAVIGMAHRGRLNVLANIVGKSYEQIFREFEGEVSVGLPHGSGDVMYHLGASGKHTSPAGAVIRVGVAPNPSHLESVDPVVEGIVRAKQDLAGSDPDSVLPILLHGDAAFAGQGVVQETLMMSQLRGYRTGGTVHVIVNNQIGFTTGSEYGRSSTYASDVAKMVQAPIFHVNGDDPEACVGVARMAFEFREAFNKDVVIDMWCYRRLGHQEVDDPSFTQPLMYRAIQSRRSVRKLYVESLVTRGDLTMEEAEHSLQEFGTGLQQIFDETHETSTSVDGAEPDGSGPTPVRTRVADAVDGGSLRRVIDALTTVPDGFHLHPKLERWLQQRRDALTSNVVDWSLAEALAFGSALLEGSTVRLAGEDSRRGTFNQRHCVLVDQETAEEYAPLGQLGRFIAEDSLLSEFAALGFEYGYSVANPEALVVWEAQFGDFANGAQVVIDEFISAGEDRWRQPSSLVLLLPHGYEGQGPDHSSARLERFLGLCADDNMRMVVPSTPAQYFHALRRQLGSGPRKPLIVTTPKSLLRLRSTFSAASEFTYGTFLETIPDPVWQEPGNVSRVLLCQGKMFWDLANARAERDLSGAALVRIEQLYPFPGERIRELLDGYPQAEFLWVQEEPQNMGAWLYLRERSEALGIDLKAVTRAESPAPATGSLAQHVHEKADLLDRSFAGL